MMTWQQRSGRRRWRRGLAWMLAGLGGLGGLGGCGLMTDAQQLPPKVQDPATVQTPSGAVERYRNAFRYVGPALDYVITTAGLITDELAALPLPFGVQGSYSLVDGRLDLSEVSEEGAQKLHRLRAQAREARGFVAAYLPDTSRVLSKQAAMAHLLVVEAYAEVWLADLFCSGIPLSTVDFNANYTLASGSTTAEVYQHAVALFDSALALASDSVRVQHAAAVGQGRALLALGRSAEAARAVEAVPDDYTYQVEILDSTTQVAVPWPQSFTHFRRTYDSVPGTPSAADREGLRGLDYRASNDPRTVATVEGIDTTSGETVYFPAKYDSATAGTMASGIEARLIEAEAALEAGAEDGRWLARLNHLRQTAWRSIVPAITGALPALPDPGSAAARLDLVYRERAFWLYLTGHRQGDLRRLIRNHAGRSPGAVYPSGFYPGVSGRYGDEVVIPVPESERLLNPKYTGCFHRNP